MLASIRSRILAACLAVIAVALTANTSLNYSVANGYNRDAINHNLNAVLTGHETGIEDWVASKTQMIVSVEDAALAPDPSAALKQVASAGGFTNALTKRRAFLIPLAFRRTTIRPGALGTSKRSRPANPL